MQGWWETPTQRDKNFKPQLELERMQKLQKIYTDKWAELLEESEKNQKVDREKAGALMAAINDHDKAAMRWHYEFPELGFDKCVGILHS